MLGWSETYKLFLYHWTILEPLGINDLAETEWQVVWADNSINLVLCIRENLYSEEKKKVLFYS